MMPGFTSRKRAEEFDALIASDPRSLPDGEFAELLELVGMMRAVPDPVARPAYVADLRARLVEAAAAQEVRVIDDALAARLTPTQKTDLRRERRVATVLGGFAVASATASMAVAAQGAMPGDVLYPVKRAIEDAQTGLQSDDADRAATLLSHAEKRLAEVKQLNEDGADDAELTKALDELAEQSGQAADLAIESYRADGDAERIADLRSFATSGAADLAAMSSNVPEDARAALVTATQTLRQVDKAAVQACPTCGDGAGAMPDLALASSLEELLAGEGTRVADLGLRAEKIADNTATSPAKKPQHKESDTTSGTSPVPVAPPITDDATGAAGDVGETVDEGVEDATDGVPDTSSGSKVVDGVTGLLGAITNPLLP